MIIAEFILSTLMVFPRPKNKKLVLDKTIFHVKVCEYLLRLILPIKVAIIQQEVLTRLMKALDDNQNFTNSVRLTTKHVILNVVVNIHSSFVFNARCCKRSLHPSQKCSCNYFKVQGDGL
jgi:hypothetical protein